MPLKSLIHSFCYYFFLSVLPYFTGTRRSIGVILNKWISNFLNSLVNILKDSHTNCLLKSTVLRNHIFNSIRRTKAVAIGFLNANIWILTLINFLEDSLSYYLEKKNTMHIFLCLKSLDQFKQTLAWDTCNLSLFLQVINKQCHSFSGKESQIFDLYRRSSSWSRYI